MQLDYSLNKIQKAAQFVLDNLANTKIVLLDGSMGAGKTTLTKAICKQLKIQDNVSSPTFSIVNEYQNLEKTIIYHFDFYRIEDIEEALNIGVEDYFYSGNLCIIEWGSRIENILPDEYILVSLEVKGEQERKLTITHER